MSWIKLMPSIDRRMKTTYPHGIMLKLCLFLGAIIILAFVGCTNPANDDLIDRSLLTKKPCAPPCWYGLELDRSGREDVYVRLKQLPFIDQSSIREAEGYEYLGDNNGKEISWSCSHPLVTFCGGTRLAYGKLILVWYAVGYNLSFREVVDILGPPTYIDYHPYHPEVGGCVIQLNWPDQNISVDTLDTKHDDVCQAIKQGGGIPEDTPVTTIYYAAKGLFSTASGENGLHQPWPGFAKP